MTVGDAVQFRLNPNTLTAYVYLPDGKRLQATPHSARAFLDTDEPGIYSLSQVKADGDINTYFDVNVPDEWLMERISYGISADTGIEHDTSIPLKNPPSA